MDTDQLLKAAELLQNLGLFRNDRPDWLPAIAAIGGAFVGGISAGIPSGIGAWLSGRRERESVCRALVSEIQALRRIIEVRQYLEHAVALHMKLVQTPDASENFEVNVPDHYNQIFKHHIGAIGKLHPVDAAEITAFHQLLSSVVIDVRPEGSFAQVGVTADGAFQLIQLLQEAIAVATRIEYRHPA